MANLTTIMDKKGKITIPAKIRKEEKFTEGTTFTFIRNEDGLVLVPLLSREELKVRILDKVLLKKSLEEDSQIELE